jgi:hypothetical protein
VAASDSYLGRPFLLAFLSPRPGAAVQSIDSKEFSLWRRNQALGLGIGDFPYQISTEIIENRGFSL